MMRFAAFGFALMAAWLLASLGGNALGQAPAASSASVESVSPDLAPLVVRDEDLELLLEEQDRLAERGAWELAIPLLQRMLDEGRDLAVKPASGKPSTPLRDRLEPLLTLADAVEQRMARLPAAGLAHYRLRADGPARALLAEAEQKWHEFSQRVGKKTDDDLFAAEYWRILEEVDRRYFFSSHGDDAAWLLALDALDRHDFVSASRRLERLARWHPDPSSMEVDLWLRKALADAYLADEAGARSALAKAEARSRSSKGAAAGELEAREAIRRQVERLLTDPAEVRSIGGARERVRKNLATAWRFEQGSSEWLVARSIHLREDEAEQATSPAAVAAQVARLTAIDAYGPGYDELAPRRDADATGRRWLDSGWSPPALPTLSIGQGRLITKSDGQWRDREFPFTQESPVPLILGAMDRAQSSNQRASDDTAGLPAAWAMLTPRDVALREPPRRLTAHDATQWADGLRYAITSQGRRVFSIEPSSADEAKPLPFAARRWSWRQRSNHLSAYDVTTGRLVWSRLPEEVLAPSDGATESSIVDATFLGPLVMGRRYGFVPTLVGATLYIAALRPDDGTVVWTTRLAGEPRIGAWPWSSLQLACEGDEVYAAAGVGVIAALRQETGATRWATAYPRSFARRASVLASGAGSKDPAPTTGIAPSWIPDGWDEDRLATHGRWLIVTASDADRLIVLDRRTGAPHWTSPRRLPADGNDAMADSTGDAATHCLAVARDTVCVGGADSLRAYSLATGKLMWRQMLGKFAGRALVGEDLIVVPVLSVAQSQRRRLLGAPDGLGGEALEIELVAVELTTGVIRERRRVATNGPLPMNVHLIGDQWALSTPDRWLELTPSTRSAPAALGTAASAPVASATAVAESAPLPASLVRRELAATRASDQGSNAPTSTSEPRPQAPRCLLTDLAQGQVVELDLAGQVIWKDASIRLPGSCGAWRDGRRWVVDHGRNVVVEYNERGQRVAELSGLPGRPSSITAAIDGSVWMAFPDLGLVGQVDRLGKWRRVERMMGRPVDVVPCVIPGPANSEKSGESICVALWEGRQAIILGENNSPRRAIDFETAPRSLCASSDGSVFATFASPGQVLRLDFAQDRGEGTVSLARGGWQGLRRSFRLTDGRWLVAEASGVSFYDAAGKLVWKREGDLNGGLAVVE